VAIGTHIVETLTSTTLSIKFTTLSSVTNVT